MRQIRIGILTPSSNTVLEPTMARMAGNLPNLSIHFSRFKVTQISLDDAGFGQFSLAPMMAAAELLTHAGVDAIVWAGTSAAWLGFDRDEELCQRINSSTGVPATSSTLAFREAFAALGAKRIGLVTPYRADVQERILTNWAEAGFPCMAERHLDLSRNFAFAEVGEPEVADLVRAVAAEGCDVAALVCTNLRGAGVASHLERELGVPVLDSVAVTLWAALRLVGVDTAPLAAWGCLFAPDHSRSVA